MLEDRALLAVLTVNSADDTTIADGDLTLREAIALVNHVGDANQALGRSLSDDEQAQISGLFGDDDTIRFDNLLQGDSIDLLGTQLPTLTADVTIDGPGDDHLAIDAQQDSRIFEIAPGVTGALSGLTLQNGRAFEGGGIFNAGTLTVTASFFDSNSADSSSLSGGGIWNGGTLTVTATTFEENSAVGRRRFSGSGGGIANAGTLTVTNSTFEENSAVGGGGIANEGMLTVTAGTFEKNSAIRFAGGILNLGTLTVTASTFQGNSAFSRHSGGIFNSGTLTVTNSTLSGNSARIEAGGIGNYFGSLTVTNSTFEGNTAGFAGGGIFNIDGGTLTVTASTFEDNSAAFGGGGIANLGSSTLTVINSTLSGNSANIEGGGIGNFGTLTVTNSTIVLNRADADGDDFGSGGGIFTADTAATTLHNSIVAGNVRGAVGDDHTDDLQGAVDSASAHNLIGDPGSSGGLSDGDNGNLVGDGDGGVLALAAILDLELKDNGGLTRTHALVAGSHALDAGNDSLAADADGQPLTTDQRGLPRLVGAAVDIGAYEVQARQLVEQIAEQVDMLRDDGVLNAGQAQALTLVLREDPGDVGRVQAFLHKMEAFILAGTLDEDDEGTENLLLWGRALLSDLTHSEGEKVLRKAPG